MLIWKRKQKEQQQQQKNNNKFSKINCSKKTSTLSLAFSQGSSLRSTAISNIIKMTFVDKDSIFHL